MVPCKDVVKVAIKMGVFQAVVYLHCGWNSRFLLLFDDLGFLPSFGFQLCFLWLN